MFEIIVQLNWFLIFGQVGEMDTPNKNNRVLTKMSNNSLVHVNVIHYNWFLVVIKRIDVCAVAFHFQINAWL